MLQKVFEILAVVNVVLTFVITVAEGLWEGQPKSGEEKKKFVMEQVAGFRAQLREAIVKLVGQRWERVVDIILSDWVVSIIIDLTVLWLNRSGIFREGGSR